MTINPEIFCSVISALFAYRLSMYLLDVFLTWLLGDPNRAIARNRRVANSGFKVKD